MRKTAYYPVMPCGRFVFLGFCFFTILTTLEAQGVSLDEIPEMREWAVVVSCISRIIEENQNEVWNFEDSRVTFPGRPVRLRLVGSNLVVSVQFTPFLRANGQHILVAQGQTWINTPNEGMTYHITMQTIPLTFGEQVYFFPLGSMEADDEARIEIQLMIEPFLGNEASANRGRDRDEAPNNRNDAPRERNR